MDVYVVACREKIETHITSRSYSRVWFVVFLACRLDASRVNRFASLGGKFWELANKSGNLEGAGLSGTASIL
ncbi:MAG: hypothetical protein M1490_02700 [Candidatus Bathyarchaeota archaeon]|nr:hypothetical protein [Candidatus Bathyarchaeota archaeon]